jgi:transcriptional regulator with XRE-family HTH domain
MIWSLVKKLQQLRKNKEFTQEELAQHLYVSRAAVSKWESGRGYPNIDSLKAIAGVFCVSVDELLSGDELLGLAEAEQMRKEKIQLKCCFVILKIQIALKILLKKPGSFSSKLFYIWDYSHSFSWFFFGLFMP